MKKIISTILIAACISFGVSNGNTQDSTNQNKMPSQFTPKSNGSAPTMTKTVVKGSKPSCNWVGWSGYITLTNQNGECCYLRYLCEDGYITEISF